MKFRKLLTLGFFLFSMISTFQVSAQLVKEVDITSEKTQFEMIVPNSYVMEIAGPNGYYWKDEVAYTKNISISNVKKDGTKFGDGAYKMQLTPIVTLTDAERKELRTLSHANEHEKIAAFRLAHNLPEIVDVFNISFSIRNGKFVTSNKEGKLKMPSMVDQWQQDHPELYASVNEVNIVYGQSLGTPAMDNSAEEDQVFIDDVIVDGSLCVGMDCVNGENFGFDTQRIKENNLRLHFDDTSASASFPSNDWRITINDSGNGGSSYFGIEDATSGRMPFRIVAGAPANALYVDAQGDVGIGNANPIVETHITDGDSPTIRLEQDGSSGFGSQTWDIAGNETNFFIRDVTNGSLLPFRIKPSAPKNSIFIDSDGDIGLGSENPSSRLQVESGDLHVKAGNVGINKTPNDTYALDVLGNSQFTGLSVFTGDPSFFLSSGATFLTSSFTPLLKLDASGVVGKVGINTATPSYELEVCGTIATTEMTVTTNITCSSDLRFKENVQPLAASLDKLMKLRGVNYDWKVNDFPEKGFTADNQIGFIAQEMEEIFPELVSTDAKGYKAVDYSKLTPVLVEAVKEQQEIITDQKEEIAALQNQLDELQGLKAQVDALAEMVSALNADATNNETAVENTAEKK